MSRYWQEVEDRRRAQTERLNGKAQEIERALQNEVNAKFGVGLVKVDVRRWKGLKGRWVVANAKGLCDIRIYVAHRGRGFRIERNEYPA